MYVADIQNDSCKMCSLYKGCASVCNMGLAVPDAEYKEPREGCLMVVGDYPATSDDENGTVMRSKKEEIFWHIAKDVVRVNLDYIYPTYASKCKPPEGMKPSEPYINTCASRYIVEEVIRLKPKAILLLGSIPMTAFGYSGSVSKLRGSVNEIQFEDGDVKHKVKVIIAQSPGYVARNTAELKNFALDINKAWAIVAGYQPDKESPTRVTMCTTLEQVEELIGYIHQTRECTFDFEGNKLTDMKTFDPSFFATLLAVSFQHGSAYTIPLFHFDSPFTKKEVMHILKRFSDEVWSNPKIRKINQNIKYDMHVAARYGFGKFRGRLDCTMIMHSLYDDLSKHSIKEWLPNFIPEFNGWELEIKGTAWDKIPLRELSEYAGVDADGAFRGCTILEQKLLEDERVYKLYRNLSMFALRTLYGMERRGMLIGRGEIITYESKATELLTLQRKKMNAYAQVRRYCEAQKQRVVAAKLEELREKKATAKGKNADKYQIRINNIKAGIEKVYKGFNYGSTPQLNKLLFTKEGFGFKIPYNKKKKENAASTGADVLKGLNDTSGFIFDLQVWRAMKTNKDRYLTGMQKMMDEYDRIHTTYGQANVKTGRLSSSKPNIQNVASHVKVDHPYVHEVVSLVKKSFTVPEGFTLLNWDFSQAELRMIAELANEMNMINAYNSGQDLHKLTATHIMGISMKEFLALPEKEIDAWRQKAKAANFGLIYMQSPEGFMEYAKSTYGVKLTLAEATKIHAAFFAAYPKLEEYHATYIAKAKRFGYVRTLFGRRGHYPDVNSTDSFLRGNAERELVNMPVQGSNGENTVFALSMMDLRLPRSVKLCNTVHDSIMAYCPNKIVPYVVDVGVDTCLNLPTLQFFGKEMTKLKMAVDVQYSNTNWKELKKYVKDDWLALGLK